MREDDFKKLKKVVGKKPTADVWDRLYQLNKFAAKLGLMRAACDGYAVRKVVGKSRQSWARELSLNDFTVMRGKQYADLISATRQVEIKTTAIAFLDAGALVQLKEKSQREKDQIDVAALKRIKKKNDR